MIINSTNINKMNNHLLILTKLTVNTKKTHDMCILIKSVFLNLFFIGAYFQSLSIKVADKFKEAYWMLADMMVKEVMIC